MEKILDKIKVISMLDEEKKVEELSCLTSSQKNRVFRPGKAKLSLI